MTPKTFFETYEREHIESVCTDAGTNFANFQQLALYGGSVSRRLAKRLAEASDGEMSVLEILYPEDFSRAVEG